MTPPFGKNDHVPMIKAIAQGMHDAGELTCYAELGTRSGATFNAVAPLVKGTAYAIDVKDYSDRMKHNANMSWHRCTSHDFLRQYKGKPFDLVFIDADHHFVSSRLDFELTLPLVRDNGIILLHDTYPPNKRYTSPKFCGDTFKTAEYIKRLIPKIEVATLPFYYGITIVRKSKKQLAWR